MAEESNTLRLQQVICPSCKRPINTFNPNKLMTECPYCHSKMVNPLVKPKDVPVPDRIIPFTTDEKTFEEALVKSLVDKDYVPGNIFEVISTDDVIQAYLPMYLFEGTYNASWSCESSYVDQEVNIEKNNVSTQDVKKWRPQNGNSAGNFAFLCLANEGNEIPEELRQFTHLFPYDIMMSKEYTDGMIDFNDNNMMTIERNADETLVWQKHGKDMVEKTAENSALSQLTNQEIRNFRASCSYNLTTKGKYVYAPFWFVYYNYAGKKFYFLMDGIGKRTEYNYPVNQDEIDLVKGKENIKTIVTWLWPLALLLGYLFNSTTAFVYFIIWLITKLVVVKIMNYQIKEQLENSQKQRQAGASRL